jgi:uncharacterized membrane protein YfcA
VLGLGQLEAQATSLLSVLLVAAVGAWRQHGYGKLRARRRAARRAVDRGNLAGVVIASSVSERTLEVAFVCLVLFVACRLVRRAFAT